MSCQGLKIWRCPKSPYLCTVFFIVLDLRLTKDWLSGIDSLFLCTFPNVFPKPVLSPFLLLGDVLGVSFPIYNK